MSAPAGLFDDIKSGKSLKSGVATKSSDFALQRARLDAQIKAGKKVEEITDVDDAVKEAYKEELALGGAQ
jgi:hypothetical protein